MAIYPFRLPDIGEGIAEAEIVAWHIKVGDEVEEDQPIADMMTDKATIEMTSPVAGRVIELAGVVGDRIAIGATLVTFETDGTAAEEGERGRGEPTPARAQPTTGEERQAPEPVPQPPRLANPRILASPAVRARARDLGIDLGSVRPAQGERVRHADLDAHLRYGSGSVPDPASTPLEDRVEEIRLVGLRRRIAERMAEAKRAIPHFSYVEECDVTALESLRAVMNGERGERPKLTLLPFLIRAMVRAIAEVPMVNARFDDVEQVVQRHSAIHLGLATQTSDGLMVPVLRDAGRHDVWQLAAAIALLAEGARSGQLAPKDLSGSTITLSSLGALGGIAATPIVNWPEVAIVGVNRIVERPVAIDGRVEIRKMMNLSSSFDHRIIDGHDAARFVQAIRRRIEAPALLFA